MKFRPDAAAVGGASMQRNSMVMKIMTLHDILTAWQDDRIEYREAMRLAKIDTLDELYEAAALSGVNIRTRLSEFEERQADLVADLIRGQARLRLS